MLGYQQPTTQILLRRVNHFVLHNFHFYLMYNKVFSEHKHLTLYPALTHTDSTNVHLWKHVQLYIVHSNRDYIQCTIMGVGVLLQFDSAGGRKKPPTWKHKSVNEIFFFFVISQQKPSEPNRQINNRMFYALFGSLSINKEPKDKQSPLQNKSFQIYIHCDFNL